MTQIKRTAIAERKTLKVCYLQGEYAAGQPQMSPIHAYNEVDARRKKQFLDDSCLYMCSVSEHLCMLTGFTEQIIHVNSAGGAPGHRSGALPSQLRGRFAGLAMESEGGA
jgi:hypothetical protein